MMTPFMSHRLKIAARHAFIDARSGRIAAQDQTFKRALEPEKREGFQLDRVDSALTSRLPGVRTAHP